MTNARRIRMETLERRTLLAHFGLDLSFGDAGYAPFDGTHLVAPAQGGKVLVVGPDGAVRLNPDGMRDESFVDRTARSDVPREPQTATVREQKLFVGGFVRNDLRQIAAVYVRKVNLSTGTGDSGFGVGGVATFLPVIAVKGATVIAYAPASLIATPDGGVVVAVTQWLRTRNFPDQPQAIVLHKLNAAGQLDQSFGTNGVVTAEVLIEEFPVTGVQLAGGYADGRFLFVGGSEYNPTIKRFNADGSPDTSFGDGGVVAPDAAPPFGVSDPSFGNLTIQADGKILVPFASTHISLKFSNGFLVRFNDDGTRDPSFGDDGVFTFGREEGFFGLANIALDSVGRIIGIARDELYRLTPAGAIDLTFDDDGLATIARAALDEHLGGPVSGSLTIDAAGNIILAQPDRMARIAGDQQRVDLARDGIVHVDGTPGGDTITASLAADTITVTFNGQSFSFAAGDVAGFFVTGAAGDDHIDLSAADLATTVNAGEGHDSIFTGDAADWINCGAGDDTVDAGGGEDLVFGFDGDDSIYGNEGDDRVFGEYGNDSISGGGGNDRLYGGHTDTVESDEYTSGEDGSDSLSGNAGNDRIDGQLGNDRIAGNGGRDRLFGGDGGDRIYGGAGGDWLYGGQGPDQLFGEGGLDRLYADYVEDYYSVDTLHGNAGDDILITRDGLVDYLFGDGGNDSAVADDLDILTSIELVS